MKKLFGGRFVELLGLCIIALLGIIAAQAFLASRPEAGEAKVPIASGAEASTASVSAEGGVAAGAVNIPAASPLDQTTALVQPFPKSMTEYIKGSDLILIGTIRSFVKQGVEGPYDSTGITDSRPDIPQLEGFGFSYYEVQIDELIWNPQNTEFNSPLLLRTWGYYNEQDANPEYPQPEVGDRKLFGLRLNPDRSSYGYSFGPWSAINLDGNEVSFFDKARSSVRFAERSVPEDFLADLRKAVASQ